MLCHVLWEIARDDKAVKLSHIEKAVEILIFKGVERLHGHMGKSDGQTKKFISCFDAGT